MGYNDLCSLTQRVNLLGLAKLVADFVIDIYLQIYVGFGDYSTTRAMVVWMSLTEMFIFPVFFSTSSLGLWQRSNGSSGMVQEVHEVRKCQRPNSGLGSLLPCVPADLKAAASGGGRGTVPRQHELFSCLSEI